MSGAPNLFALEAAKEAAEVTLANAYAEGHLSDEVLDERMERLAHANEMGEVERLVADLSPVEALATISVSTALVPSDQVSDEKRIVSVLSERKQKGRWIAARHNQVIAVIGSALLDLREAQLPAGEVEISVRAGLAEITVLVPPGMQVEIDCNAILGEVNQDDRTLDAPPHPTRIRVTGWIVLGELSVKEALPGESKRDTRRRRRAERKRLKAQAKRALKSGR